jgi:hypothetical protein
MADFGLFIGFGAPVPGREVAAAKVFGEAMAYWQARKAAGDIESIEVAILEPHGGDLNGFILVRGDAGALARIRGSEEFARLRFRAGFVVQDVGVTAAQLDGEAARFVAQSNEITADLA